MTALDRLKSTLDFVTDVIRVGERVKRSTIESVNDLAIGVRKIYDDNPTTVHTQLNILKLMYEDENENVHSRILRSLLAYNPNNSWKELESFLSDAFDTPWEIPIQKPKLINEYTNQYSTKRIDLLIYEPNRYAVIVENKSNDAPFQPHQLANYIEMMLDEDFRKDQIYIILLTDNQSPSDTDDIWISANKMTSSAVPKSYKRSFESRYREFSYRDGILSWLKSTFNDCRDPLLKSLTDQYIDFIEQKFEISPIYHKRMNEVKNYLKEVLAFNGDATHDACAISSKVVEINNVLSNINDLYQDVAKQYIYDLERKITISYPNVSIEKKGLKGNNPTLSVHLKKVDGSRIGVVLQIELLRNQNWLGVDPIDSGTKEAKQLLTKNIVQSLGGFAKGSSWCYYKKVTFEDAFDTIFELVSALIQDGWLADVQKVE